MVNLLQIMGSFIFRRINQGLIWTSYSVLCLVDVWADRTFFFLTDKQSHVAFSDAFWFA